MGYKKNLIMMLFGKSFFFYLIIYYQGIIIDEWINEWISNKIIN